MIDKPSPSFEMAQQEEFRRFTLHGIETGFKRGYGAALKDIEAMFPLACTEELPDGTHQMVRGKREATHIRPLTSDERAIVDTVLGIGMIKDASESSLS